MQVALEARGGFAQGGDAGAGEVVGDLHPCGPALEEVPPEPEEHGLGSGGGALRAPLLLHSEETRQEASQRPRGVDQKTGAREAIDGARVGAVGDQPGVEGRVLALELLQERAVQVRQPLVAVEVLVGESVNAEREISPGGGWRRRRGFQESGILPEA